MRPATTERNTHRTGGGWSVGALGYGTALSMSPRKSERNAAGTRTEHATHAAASSCGDGLLQRRANCDHCPLASDADRFRAANRADSREVMFMSCVRGVQYNSTRWNSLPLHWKEMKTEWTRRQIPTWRCRGVRRIGSGSGCPFCCVCGIRALYEVELTGPCATGKNKRRKTDE